jgi:peptidoglycan/LPS O-acetylase OafA/YrhL
VNQEHAAKNRFHEIDLLRFLAALAVVFFHYAFRGFAADNMSPLAFPGLAPLAKYGYLGVDLFFLISGFVILMTASSGSTRRFVISRFARLYPAFWFCCTVTFLVMLGANHPLFPVTWKQYLINMTMLNRFVGVPSIDPCYWSLFIELKFYGLIFLLLLLRQMERVEIYLGLWLVATLILTLWKIRYIGALLIPDYSAYFIAGAMIFRINKYGLSKYRIGVIGASLCLAIIKATQKTQDQMQHYSTTFNPWIVSSLVAAFFLALLLISLGHTRRMGSDKFLLVGVLTYPLYLLHHNIGFLIFNTFFTRINPHALFWGVIVLMLLLAHLVNRGIEKRFAPPLKVLLYKALSVTSK